MVSSAELLQYCRPGNEAQPLLTLEGSSDHLTCSMMMRSTDDVQEQRLNSSFFWEVHQVGWPDYSRRGNMLHRAPGDHVV